MFLCLVIASPNRIGIRMALLVREPDTSLAEKCQEVKRWLEYQR